MKYQVGDSVIVATKHSTFYGQVAIILIVNPSPSNLFDVYKVDIRGTYIHFFEYELTDTVSKPQGLNSGAVMHLLHEEVRNNSFGITTNAMTRPGYSMTVKLNDPKCECGINFCGGGLHSSWCPVKN